LLQDVLFSHNSCGKYQLSTTNSNKTNHQNFPHLEYSWQHGHVTMASLKAAFLVLQLNHTSCAVRSAFLVMATLLVFSRLSLLKLIQVIWTSRDLWQLLQQITKGYSLMRRAT